jgi:hypothetical protein
MYEIFYYGHQSMAQRTSDMDQISDDAIYRYPAPTGTEVAEAINSAGYIRYGYDGEWHDTPPAEAILRDRKIQAEREKLAEEARQKTLPHVIGWSEVHGVQVRLPDGEVKWITENELTLAARQEDRQLAAIYGDLREEYLDRRNQAK